MTHADKRKIAVHDMVNHLLVKGAERNPSATQGDLVYGALGLVMTLNDAGWLTLGRESGHYRGEGRVVHQETRDDVEKLLRSMTPRDDEEVFPTC